MTIGIIHDHLPHFDGTSDPRAEFVDFCDQTAGRRPEWRMSLPDLMAESRKENIGAYEVSLPTSPAPGKRWLTRNPEAWSARRPSSPIFLCEVTSVSRGDGRRIYSWRIVVEGEREAWAQAVMAHVLSAFAAAHHPRLRRALVAGGNARYRRRARRSWQRSLRVTPMSRRGAYSAALVRIHELEEDQTPEADSIRDGMDDAWDALSLSEQAHMRSLSTALGAA